MENLGILIIEKTKNIQWDISIEIITHPIASTLLYVDCIAIYNNIEIHFNEYLYTTDTEENVAEFIIRKVTDAFVKELFRE